MGSHLDVGTNASSYPRTAAVCDGSESSFLPLCSRARGCCCEPAAAPVVNQQLSVSRGRGCARGGVPDQHPRTRRRGGGPTPAVLSALLWSGRVGQQAAVLLVHFHGGHL